MSRPRTTVRVAVAATAVAITVVTATILAVPVLAAARGTVVTAAAPSAAVGSIDYTVYLPPGYDDSSDSYPTLYLLHGRGDTMAAWTRVATDLDELISSGQVQPMVVVMPDAPWNERGSWYTDSQYTGSDVETPGVQVETAFTRDLVDHVDTTYRTVDDRQARAVGGYSMGGAGALRFALAHQGQFSSALVLSAATYVPQPPGDSSVRDYGAYGWKNELFWPKRYTELSYPTALKNVDPELPVHLFIAVGDDEWANPDPADARHDLDLESAQLYNTARRAPGVTAELRILDGGHDWDVWQPAFREGIVDISARLRTSPALSWEARLTGTAGDDRAGGVLPLAEGGEVLAISNAAALDGVPYAGGLDVTVVRNGSDGATAWRHPIATAAADRSYGVVPGASGSFLVAGYTRGDLDGSHPSGATDDGFVAVVSAAGARLWTLQAGAASAADRFYAIASDGEGGGYVAGYSSGSFAGQPSAGDKDAVVARVSGDGTLLWSRQLGGAGEDKALALALTTDGVVVGGVTGQAMPGQTSQGGADGWAALLSASGDVRWIQQVGTSSTDQVAGVAARPDGSVVLAGHTGGSLAGESHGENDVFAQALGVDGATIWTRQLGGPQDDRGAAASAAADGSVLVVATTYGSLGDPVGGNDVATVRLTADGTPSSWTQLGSSERDGADEFDEANLFVGRAGGATLLSGLTYGAPEGATNAGRGDVFVMQLE